MATARPFPIVSLIFCLAAVLVLCALGVWQVERLAWKNNLQQQLDAAFAQTDLFPFTAEQLTNIQKGQVVRGRIDGQLDFSKAILLNGRIQDGHSTMTLVAPLATSDKTVMMVEVGCKEKPDLDDIKSLRIKSVILSGLLRDPQWSFAAPKNIPEKNEWWRLDATEIGGFWGLQNVQKPVITVDNTTDLLPFFQPCPVEKKLRNDHLSYAFFWFTMAGVLSLIWAIRFLKPYLQSA